MAQWVKPTGYNDPSSDWLYETQAYDDNVSQWAYDGSDPPAGWSGYLELTHAAMYCSKVRFYAYWNSGLITSIDVDVYYGEAWHDVFEGAFANETWIEKVIGSTQLITAFRFRFYHSVETVWAALGEVDFYEQTVVPTVTTQAVTDILSTTATGNGNITALGGENATRRGFCYMVGDSGDPTIADSVAYDDGSFGTGAYTKGLTGLSPGTTYRVRAYAVNSAGVGYGTTVQFTTDKVAPTVTVQAPTDVMPTTATANGNITALGGENATHRGFKYGLTKTDTWDAHDEGSFGAGAYTKALTDLSPNTTYWIQAYATNSIGTSYGAWVEFQTAAQGTIPTGTRIFMCSDYSGYTYKLMRSETDDGEAYTAYFVISTDLSNKQALAYFKRILDLHLYFKSEDSGTAEIEVKRDNEAEWQEVGSVALTGTAEIIVKHLACRIFAKHFLFKISAANQFRFLGCLFQFLPGGMR